MVSYFKTQWIKLVVAVLCWIPIIVTCCTSTATTETLEGLTTIVGDLAVCGAWFLASVVSCIMSMVDYNSRCADMLNKRIALLEQRAITDIEETGKNEYICRRKLGPDKEN
jgi:hypothetical protein